MDLTKLTTERRNDRTMHLDELSSLEILTIMNEEDAKVPLAIKEELPTINTVVEEIIKSFNKGGRLIYIGAGTSGRLGILDAAECVPTFGTDPEMVQGIIAGGNSAMTVAVEGAEDSKELAIEDLKNIKLNENDTVIGIAASGRTPYVIGGLEYAKSVNATTATIACNKNAEISNYAEFPIEVDAGAEVLTGSTRLKAGTTQKLILNMLSTVSMIGIGKVYNNLMVDVKATNEKLVERSKRIIMEATGCDYPTAENTFETSNQNVKLAIIMILTDVTKEEAAEKLTKGKGFIKNSI
ncbi:MULTISPECIES: N-acetylmuramic acid 6-phosphate etherase [Vagococcus]|uniref:N-acetylmuramic acid 6-phosphate etherase n=1 Tax=Vagococcus fluvialis bH819 TaxID=1255619 RepID=A0A1X6WMP4_9ENTE|nr:MULTISPECIES: N-acetylmuramic acid 6-phosphate etherase [Vagococcus]SLM85603.1 N-acetylmuramic acid 6-phosphate etherase [Vagococcus fluvialis bH819]HCM89571.1 N-acetylmuramic acid 6-phosphate etherase [Vagococcus sp.]